MNERDRAIMEVREIAAEEEFFKARPALDCDIGRRSYRSAFSRAWQESLLNTELFSDVLRLRLMLAFAYSKLHRSTFSDQNDALMLDEIKLYLERGAE